MTKAKYIVGKTRCEFLPKKEDEGVMLDARDGILVCLLVILYKSLRQASVKDIEDIVVAGKASCVCPYYSTRRAVKQSQVCHLFDTDMC